MSEWVEKFPHPGPAPEHLESPGFCACSGAANEIDGKCLQCGKYRLTSPVVAEYERKVRAFNKWLHARRMNELAAAADKIGNKPDLGPADRIARLLAVMIMDGCIAVDENGMGNLSSIFSIFG